MRTVGSVTQVYRLLLLALTALTTAGGGWAVDPFIVTVAGNGTAAFAGDGSAATAASINGATGIARDAAGNLYIADSGNHRIRKVTVSSGLISTVAGTGTAGFGGDGAAATSALLYNPTGIAVDGSGNLYIADSYNYRIRKVTISTGIITTVAGNGSAGFGGDGAAATAANLYVPTTVAVDGSNNLFIADTNNNRIRKVTASTGFISTIAGNGTAGFAGDGAAATAAQLQYPYGVALDASGNVYIADFYNNRIRKVTISTGVISTIAGNGTAGSAGDGGTATSANLYYPFAVTVDSTGAVFIADQYNNKIRKVSGGVISTVVGSGSPSFSGDGASALTASLYQPAGVVVTSTGAIYVSDKYNYRIRLIGNGPLVLTSAKAIPAPVTGTTTVVSALGADNAYAESNLIYTWATAGTPPAAVTFSPNTSNAAKASTATFTKAGTYTLQVTIKDPANATVVSPMVVTVVQTPTGLAVSPATSTTGLNSTVTFTATPSGTDQFGATLVGPFPISWTGSGGGTISAGGVFTAQAVPGGPFTLTATMGSRAATAAVTVVNLAPTIATAASASPNPTATTRTTLTVLGADDGGENNLTYTWAPNGAQPASVLFTSNGINAAKSVSVIFSKSGSYSFLVTIRDAFGSTVTSTVNVTVSATASTMAISPLSVMATPGSTRTLTAVAEDQFGIALTSQPTLSWTTTGGGTIGASTGIFSASTTAGGPYSITASGGGISGTIPVTVQAIAPIAQGQFVTTALNTALPVTLQAADANADVLTYTIVAQPAHGTVTGSGANTTYTPTTGYVGSDSFSFQVSDGTLTSNTAQVQVLVVANNESVDASKSPLVMPVAFDAWRWTNDPTYATSYLQTREPGRCWQTATPGAATTALTAVGSRAQTTTAGGQITLAVTTAPLAPVTFYAPEGGIFTGNYQNVITVAANASGTASVVWNAPDGGRASILAASPLASGRVRFVVQIALATYLTPP